MNIIINYPSTQEDLDKLEDNMAYIKAMIIWNKLKNLDMEKKMKEKIIKQIVMILDNDDK